MAFGDRSGTATWHDETDTRLVTLEVDFNQSRYYPATWESQAEGGEIEVTEISLDEYYEYNEDGDIIRAVTDLTPEEKAAIVAEYNQKIASDPKVSESVDEACREAECYDGRDY
jgi:hypothetical protein